MQTDQSEYLFNIWTSEALPDELVNVLGDEEDPAVLSEEEEEPLHGLKVGQPVPQKWWINFVSIAHRY